MIELKNISVSYEDVLFENVNIKIEDEEMVAIIGKSGSGKSTLLNIMGLLEEPDEGKVYLNGNEIQAYTHQATKAMRESISYLFQNFALVDDMNVYDNLMIGLKYSSYSKKECRQKIQEVLSQVGLPHYESRIIYTLSGGEQQRVALARVFLKESHILLCDEPTGSLDNMSGEIILSLLKKYNKNRGTVVIVTHDLNLASKCDRIIDMKSFLK